MGKRFDELNEALDEALEFVRGQKKLRTKEIFVPDAPKNYKSKDIKNLRLNLGFTQQELALWLNISLNTVQAWEQGSRHPNHSSLRLLEIFDTNFQSVEKMLENKTKRMNIIEKEKPSRHVHRNR